MRYEYSIDRYDEDDLLRRIFDFLSLPSPPPNKARQCVEEIVKAGGLLEMLAVSAEHADTMRAYQARFVGLLELLNAPKIAPTVEQTKGDKTVAKFLCIASAKGRSGVEIHAGVGAIFHHAENGVLLSQLAPITGPGMDRRRDYLLSVIEWGRDALEQTCS